jgi:hypothetical protein
MTTRGLTPLLLALALSLPALGAARPAVDVRFTDPTGFTDLRRTTSDDAQDAAELADELRQFLERRAPAYLAPGERLAVIITDVDMAGDLRPSPRSLFMLRREIRAIFPPRIDLEFRLVAADGTVEREGRRTLTNNAYLFGRYTHQKGPLVHEKALLERWLAAEFPSPR